MYLCRPWKYCWSEVNSCYPTQSNYKTKVTCMIVQFYSWYFVNKSTWVRFQLRLPKKWCIVFYITWFKMKILLENKSKLLVKKYWYLIFFLMKYECVLKLINFILYKSNWCDENNKLYVKNNTKYTGGCIYITNVKCTLKSKM